MADPPIVAGGRLSFTGILLAGGASRRMGYDKAFADVGGDPLASLPLAALAGAGADEVLVIGGDQRRLEALGGRWLPDEWPGEGPLGGLITGLRAASHDLTMVLACDLPHIDVATVEELVGYLGADRSPDAVVAEIAGTWQPVPAAYRSSAAEVLAAGFDDGIRSVRRALDLLNVTVITPRRADAFTDVDRPEDLPGSRFVEPVRDQPR